MNDRETKEFTSPGGHKVVLKTYLTAREFTPIVDDKDLTNSAKTQRFAVASIVSLDGETEGIGDKLLDLPLAEYTAIVKEVGGLITDLTAEK